MASLSLENISVEIKLDNGTDNYGNPQTVSVSFGGLSSTNFDAGKLLNIIAALEPCFSNSLNSVKVIQTSNLNFW